jgi:hypothetical protein
MPAWVLGKETSYMALNLVNSHSMEWQTFSFQTEIHEQTKHSQQVHHHGGETWITLGRLLSFNLLAPELFF